MAKITAKQRAAKYAFGGEDPTDPTKPNRIPLPDYKNPKSRLKYAQEWGKKYGPLMQGRGDTPLRVNEKPVHSTLTSKQISDKVGKQYGIDPALLYASTMEEGMSGIYPGQQYLEEKMGPDKDYPLSAQWSFGLDSFLNKAKDLSKSGVLPKGFDKRYKVITDPMKAKDYAYFKTPEDGVTASAAMWKGHYQDVDDYAKKSKVNLSPKARDFFSMIGFNAGEGTARQMISDYNANGYLKDDSFMKKRPTSGKGLKADSYAETYDNVMRRVKMADALKSEGYWDAPEVPTIGEDKGLVGPVPEMAMGGQTMGMIGQMLPEIGNALMTIFDKPAPYQNQPIVNAQTAKNMTSPYAFGGDLDDIDDEQFKLYLQQMFMNQADAEEEEDEDTLSEGIDEEDDSEDAFAMGGKTNKMKKIIRNKSKYASGGMANIEVEGDEVIQTPNGQMQKMQGPSHEQGGIDMNVPDGTKIYSDRLELEGKSMQQRKINREKRLASASKLFEKSPSNTIARNTFERTKEVVGREEQQDMALQKIANKIYAQPQQGQKQAAYGDEVGDPWNDYMMSQMPGYGTQVPFMPGADTSQVPNRGSALSKSAMDRSINVDTSVTSRTAENIGLTTPSAESRYNVPEVPDNSTYSSPEGLTTGDYIGLGSNLFNAIAPIINTKNAARATRPEVNRFQGFGKQAMEANAKAQSFAGVQAANAKRELDTAAGSATLRNRLGARSINTMRALDTVTDINRNKAIGDINAGYTNQLTGLLGQEAQLANQRDQVVMSGATARDQREAQNTDNYYSNMAENLTNFGSNIGNIGRSLNQSKGNKDNIALLEAMSEYFDFGRDQSGKLVIKNKATKTGGK